MRPVPLLSLFLAIGCAPAAAQTGQAAPQPAAAPAVDAAEQEAIMDRIERELRMPRNAVALARYARAYAWQQGEDGVRRVIGVYTDYNNTVPGRRWVAESELPVVMDGGCAIVTVTYHVAEERIERVACNGHA